MNNVTELKTTEERDAEIEREEREEALRARAAYVDGLRAFADALTQNTDIPVPDSTTIYHFFTDGNDVQEIRERMAKAARALPGKVEKRRTGIQDEMLELVARFGPLTYELMSSGVCERVVVGSEEVEVEEPDPEAIAALPKVKRVEVREKVEYRCGPLLGD